MTAKKKALICGVSGQDGAYLARFLIRNDYEVFGTSRDAQVSSWNGVGRLGIADSVTRLSMVPTDFRSVVQVVSAVRPAEIYYLAGQSSVGLSFEQPVETMASFSIGSLNVLEAIRFVDPGIRFYNAGSSECFGNAAQSVSTEESPFHPCSPYGVAKAASFWQVATYRNAYDLFACTGLAFNHESPLRPDRYVTKKITNAARSAGRGDRIRVSLGNIDISRDWGWAGEYVEAMWLMLQQPHPDDYIIATGQTLSLREFVELSFRSVGLASNDYVQSDPALFRPSEITVSRADPGKAARRLGWRASTGVEEVVERMVHDVLESHPRSEGASPLALPEI